MNKKVIAIQTDGPMRKSGLGRNGKALAKYLHNTGKYEVVYFAQQGYAYNDTELKKLPFKAHGVLPDNQNELVSIQNDPSAFRDASYGNLCIDRFIKDIKPFAMIFSNDSWAFPYYNRNWWNKFHCLPHITLDSTPFQKEQIEFIKKSSTHYVWAKFAEEEAVKLGLNNVKTIPALIEDEYFKPLSIEEKLLIRKKNNISTDTFIIGFVFRNQLRKEIKSLLEGFSQFKSIYPDSKVKLLLHTNFTEGWNIHAFMEELNISNDDILTTYYCQNCGEYEIKPAVGTALPCKFCGGKDTQNYCGIHGGVSEEQLNEVYNIMDGYCHPANAGGCEMPLIEALYAGIPIATVNYSFGKTFTDESFCYTIKHSWSVQYGTQFKRACPYAESVKDYITHLYFSTFKEREEIGLKGREFALKTFSSKVVGGQWESVIDSLPEINYNYDFSEKLKNLNYPMPVAVSDDEFLTLLYDNILLQPEPANGDGRKHWLKTLDGGISREEIYKYFISVAISDNNKIQKLKLIDLFDEKDEGKRALFYVDGNLDDIYLSTALLKSFKELHPEFNIYFSCNDEGKILLKGNPYIHKLLPLIPELGDPLFVKGIVNGQKLVEYLYIPNIQTSKIPTRIGSSNDNVNNNLGVIPFNSNL
jgi:glycosyltransferase involved in cell wall biosynthesis